VSEAGSVLFGRAELERAFTALGERLVRRGVVTDIFMLAAASGLGRQMGSRLARLGGWSCRSAAAVGAGHHGGQVVGVQE
jgi:hypothetical protein